MIPQNVPVLDGKEEHYILECVRSGWVSSLGEYVPKFEEMFAKLCNTKYGVACSNGTTAIHLALLSLGIGKGDEVIVPDFTLVADSNMVLLTGAKPVFVDVDSATWCIELSQLEQHITERTKAILAVHMYGHPCDMDALGVIAKRHNLRIIEDAAQAHGSLYKGRHAGSLGDMACFSFYASKTLTTGEGGMVLSNDKDLADRARLFRSHYFPSDGSYVHEHVAFNYRLTSMQAALGIAQCEQAQRKYEMKRSMFKAYYERLANIEGLRFQSFAPDSDPCPWNVVIVVEDNFGVGRDALKTKLAERKIQTRAGFYPLHKQPAYAVAKNDNFPVVKGLFPISSFLGDRALCLPSSLNLTNSQIDYICESIVAIRGI